MPLNGAIYLSLQKELQKNYLVPVLKLREIRSDHSAARTRLFVWFVRIRQGGGGTRVFSASRPGVRALIVWCSLGFQNEKWFISISLNPCMWDLIHVCHVLYWTDLKIYTSSDRSWSDNVKPCKWCWAATCRKPVHAIAMSPSALVLVYSGRCSAWNGLTDTVS